MRIIKLERDVVRSREKAQPFLLLILSLILGLFLGLSTSIIGDYIIKENPLNIGLVLVGTVILSAYFVYFVKRDVLDPLDKKETLLSKLKKRSKKS